MPACEAECVVEATSSLRRGSMHTCGGIGGDGKKMYVRCSYSRSQF